jgi:hypothetical protein
VVQGKGRIGPNDSECTEDEEYSGDGLQRYRQAVQRTAHQDQGMLKGRRTGVRVQGEALMKRSANSQITIWKSTRKHSIMLF